MALLLMAATFVVALHFLLPTPPPAADAWTTIAVPGDGTLWEIASLHSVAGLSTGETVDLIQRENGLATAVLHPGQTLRVPASPYASGGAVARR